MSKSRRSTVIDTNVPVVANRRHGESYLLASACAKELSALREREKLFIDKSGLILAEYRNYLNYKGQPGAGDAFLRWFFNNRARPNLCAEVEISAIDHEWRLYAEFPDDDDLADFDKSDQKFVAVARVAAENARILQATDAKWLIWIETLQQNGIHVHIVCKEHFGATAS